MCGAGCELQAQHRGRCRLRSLTVAHHKQQLVVLRGGQLQAAQFLWPRLRAAATG